MACSKPRPVALGFFVWSWLKNKVYCTPRANYLTELKERIVTAFESMPEQMLSNAIDSIPERLEKCIEKKGGHLENVI